MSPACLTISKVFLFDSGPPKRQYSNMRFSKTSLVSGSGVSTCFWRPSCRASSSRIVNVVTFFLHSTGMNGWPSSWVSTIFDGHMAMCNLTISSELFLMRSRRTVSIFFHLAWLRIFLFRHSSCCSCSSILVSISSVIAAASRLAASELTLR